MKVRKVHIMTLMTALSKVYDMGVDFVDLYGETEEDGEDSVTLGFSPDYVEENMIDTQEEFNKSKENKKQKLSDEDLNLLI
jgi:hypothetical protein